MEHIEVFYAFSALCIGLMAFGAMAITYLKIREELLLYYLGFHVAFTLLTGGVLGLEYFVANISVSIDIYSGSLAAMLLYAVEFVIVNVTLLALLMFTYVLFSVDRPYFKTLLWLGGFIVLSFAYHLTMFVAQNETIYIVSYVLNSMFQIVVVLYSFILGIRCYKTLQDGARRKIARSFLFLIGMMLPATCLETILEIFFSSVSFYPIFYCGMSVVVPYYFVRYYLLQSPVSHAVSQPSSDSVAPSVMPPQSFASPQQISTETSVADTLTQYDISSREREVIELILQGRSNAEIGEILYISLSTVKTHLNRIYTKCGIKSRYELIALLKEDLSSSLSENPSEIG